MFVLSAFRKVSLPCSEEIRYLVCRRTTYIVLKQAREIPTNKCDGMAAAAPTQPKHDFNMDYIKSPPGILRIVEAVLALAALISSVEGYCENDSGRYGFFLVVVIVSMVKAILIITFFVLRLDKKVLFINIPLSLLLSDCSMLISYFFCCTLTMLSIGRCDYRIAARVIAMLLSLSVFLVLVGLNYTDFKWWQEASCSKDASNNGGTTVTESSPTVLT